MDSALRIWVHLLIEKQLWTPMHSATNPQSWHLFKLFLAQFVLSSLRLQKAVQLFLLLTLNVLLELLLIVGERFCLMEKNRDQCVQ